MLTKLVLGSEGCQHNSPRVLPFISPYTVCVNMHMKEVETLVTTSAES